jgi:hypothetical protein
MNEKLTDQIIMLLRQAGYTAEVYTMPYVHMTAYKGTGKIHFIGSKTTMQELSDLLES